MSPIDDSEKPTVMWWKDCTFYCIYIRSFCDTDRNGIGDLNGVRRQLDYLAELSIDAILLSPFYPSPLVDCGYDVSDYKAVVPELGDLVSFDRLLSEVHQRGMRLIVDLVANHTSDQHPWFEESRQSRASPKRDWYIWRDEPNDWQAALSAGSAWKWDAASEQYYLHFFFPSQPDLNWRNSDVVAAMHDVMRFWLDRGVDGFRVDAAHCLAKDVQFRNRPELQDVPIAAVNDQEYTHYLLRGMRDVLSEYGSDRLLLGEVFFNRAEDVASYYGQQGEELHLAFNFSLLRAEWASTRFVSAITEVDSVFSARGISPTWVFSNHDKPRTRSRYGGSIQRARSAAVLLLALRGIPFIYQGEELGLEDAVVPRAIRVDSHGRDGQRAPLPWSREFPHGWNGKLHCIPFPPDSDLLSVEQESMSRRSTLSLYQRLLALRRSSDILRKGKLRAVRNMQGVLLFERMLGEELLAVVANFNKVECHTPYSKGWRVVIASDGLGEDAPFPGLIRGETAVILERES